MKKRLLILCLCLSLLLSACGKTEKTQGDSTEQILNTAVGEITATSAENFSPVVGKVLRKAEKDSVFAVVTDSMSDLYKELSAEAAEEIKYTPVDASLPLEKVFVLVVADSVDFWLESVNYIAEFNFFEKSKPLAEFSGKRGNLFCFDVFLPEGAPSTRLVAAKTASQHLAAWPCGYDGLGEGAIYVGPENAFGSVYMAGLEKLSIAAAVAASIEGNRPEIPKIITPVQLMWADNQYWYTIAHALTLILNDFKGAYTWNSAEVPCHIVHDCGRALFPDLDYPEPDDTYFKWPSDDPESGENYKDTPCKMIPFDYGDSVTFEVIKSEVTARGKAYVELRVDSKSMLEKPLKFKVNWEAAEYMDLSTPFPYRLTDLQLID
ncbi:MAG TPA: hypothetical protein PKW24_04535 [Clostridiales bacterium]|nr:hypothetical protein [Clostridiales bacterium]